MTPFLLLLALAGPPHPGGSASCTVNVYGEIVEPADTKTLAATLKDGQLVAYDPHHQVHVLRTRVIEAGRAYNLITFVYE